jgi:hypothetical protein
MKILNRLFNRDKVGSIYAFKKGIHAAKMFVLIDIEDNDYNFLILPDMISYTMAKNDFLVEKNAKICEKVEILPSFVFDVCKAQYLKSRASYK